MSITKRIVWLTAWAIIFLYLDASAHAKLNVVTTTTDLAALVQAVGGDSVKVHSIVRGVQDPHYIEAKPSYMRQVNRANLLVTVGLQLEVVWLPLLINGARNPRIVPGSQNYLNTSQGLPVLEVPWDQIDRSQGDIHPEGNPHFWLDSRNALAITERIVDRLSSLSPRNSDFFQANLATFRNRLKKRIADWEERMSPFRGRKIVAYHKQWEYLAHWLGLTIIGYIEDKPGVPPGPRHIASLIERMKSRKVPVLLCANFIPPNIPQQVAQKTGAKLVYLPPSVGGESNIKTYIDLFEHLITDLEKAFEDQKGGP